MIIVTSLKAKVAAFKAWLSSKLTAYAKFWHKLWSIRLSLVSAMLSSATTAYLALPTDWLPYIPGYMKLALAVGAMLTASGAAGSVVIKQTKVESAVAQSMAQASVPAPLPPAEAPHGNDQA